MKYSVKLMRSIIFSVDRTQFHVLPCLGQSILGYCSGKFSVFTSTTVISFVMYNGGCNINYDSLYLN